MNIKKNASPNQRQAVTLLEALIALGVMAIGLIALLAFFPLSASQMAQAFKDERTTELAGNGENLFRMAWRFAWLGPSGNKLPEYDQLSQLSGPVVPDTVFLNQPGFLAMDLLAPPSLINPVQIATIGVDKTFGSIYQSNSKSTAPSYPVFIDPIGWNVRTGLPDQGWVGYTLGSVYSGSAFLALQRRTLNQIVPVSNPYPTAVLGNLFNNQLNSVQTVRYFSLLDDIYYTPNGGADTTSGSVQRGEKFNFSYLIQRPENNQRTQVHLHIVTFQNRPPTDSPASEDVAFITGGFPGSTLLSVRYPGGTNLPVNRGGWVLMVNQGTQLQADFYRVVGISPTDNVGDFNLELQQPLNTIGSHLILLQDISEVFDAGIVSLSTPPSP